MENINERPSKRQIEILKLLAEGLNNNEIGKQLFISGLTVKTHRHNLLTKYKLKNTAELISVSFQRKWIGSK